MQKQLIKQILLEQLSEIEKTNQTDLIEREVEQKAKRSLQDDLIKVIVGVRRCGKSVLCHKILQGNVYGYINFDDERFVGVKTDDLNYFLEVLKEINPNFNFLLLDEIQNVFGWELFVNRLRRNGYRVIITGSNARLLSQELATHLTGRYLKIELYPFSFREFLRSKRFSYSEKDFYLTEKRARLKGYLEEYMAQGGFPELPRVEFKDEYLRELYDKIVGRDVAERHKVKYIRDLKELSLYLLSNFGSRISYQKLKNIFEINSVHTIKNYVNYFEEAYLLFQLYSFSHKFKNQVKGVKKIYNIDNGLANALNVQSSPNQGRAMENIVCLDLKRRGKEIFFVSDSFDGEVDFVVKDGGKISQLIQVCMSLHNIETKDREIKSLLKFSRKLSCGDLLVITWDEEDEEIIKGKKIKLVPLWKWLCM